MKIRHFVLLLGIVTFAACKPNGGNTPDGPTGGTETENPTDDPADDPTDDPNPDPTDDPTDDPLTSDSTEVIITARVDVPEWATAKAPMRVHLGPDNSGVIHGTLGQGYTPVYWTTGDQILVWHVVGNNQPDNASVFDLISGAGTPQGEFRGKAVVDGQENFDDAKGINYGIFPSLAMTTYMDGDEEKSRTDGNHVYFTLSSTQNYVEPLSEDNPTFDSQTNVMLGKKEGSGALKFGNTMGVLMLRLKGTQTIHSMVLTDTDKSHYLVGNYHAYVGPKGSGVAPYKDNAFAEEGINYIDGGSNNLTLNCGGGVELKSDKATIFYFLLPAGSLSDGFEIKMDFGNSVTGTITSARKNINTIVRSEFKIMPELDLLDNNTLTWMIDDLFEQGAITEW